MLKFKSKQATLQDPIVRKPKSTHICGDLRAEMPSIIVTTSPSQ